MNINAARRAVEDNGLLFDVSIVGNVIKADDIPVICILAELFGSPELIDLDGTHSWSFHDNNN